MIAILGELRAVFDDRPVPIVGARRRAILALLAARRGSTVPVVELLAAAWPDGNGRQNTLQVAIHRLRAILPPGTVEARADGYRLAVPEELVDAARAASLRTRAENVLERDARAALALFEESLSLWRGAPLGEFGGIVFAAEVASLDELRLGVLDGAWSARAVLGLPVPVDAVGAVVVAHPRRERFVAHLVRALYNDGRIAEALDAYDSYRQVLGEEVGADPGPELRRLHLQVLRHDLPVVRQSRAMTSRTTSERRLVTVVAVRVEPTVPLDGLDGEEVVDTVDAVRRSIESRGGVVLSTVASMVVGVFGLHGSRTVRRSATAAIAAVEAQSTVGGPSFAFALETGMALVVRTISGVDVYGQPVDVAVERARRPAAVATVGAARSGGGDHGDGVPLVGRERELATVVAFLAAVGHARRPRRLTIVGAAGLGKSFLVEEAIRRVGVASCAEVRCGALASGASMRAMADSLAWPVRISDDPAARFAALRTAIEDEARRGTVVVLIEDAHASDEELLDFLDHLLWNASGPIAVIVTSRPTLVDRRPAWVAGIDGDAIPLARLDDVAIGALIASQTRSDPFEVAATTEIVRFADGNPLLALAYVGRSSAPHTSENEVSLGSLLAARVDHLDAEQRALLRVLSLMPDTATDDDIAALVGIDPSRVSGVGAALVEEGLVRCDASGYRISHAMYREAVGEEIPHRVRATMHRALAVRLHRRGAPSTTIAHHLDEALVAGGDNDDLLRRETGAMRRVAGDEAWAISDFSLAHRHLARACTLADDGGDLRLRFRAATSELLASGVGVDHLSTLHDELLAAGDHESAAEAAATLALAFWRDGHPDSADRWLGVARASLVHVDDRRTGAIVDAASAETLWLRGRLEEAGDRARHALAVAQELGLSAIEVDALHVLGAVRIERGDLDGLADLADALRVAEDANLPSLTAQYGQIAYYSHMVGRSVVAREHARRELATADRSSNRRWLWYVAADRALWPFRDGDWTAAEPLAGSLLEDADLHGSEAIGHAILAQIALGRGELETARSTVEQAIRVARAAEDQWQTLTSLGIGIRVALFDQRPDDAVLLALEVVAHASLEREVAAVDVALALRATGQGADFRTVMAPCSRPATTWHAAAVLVADGQLARAAGKLEVAGAPVEAALVRLWAADAGDHRGAPAAATFFARAGASAFVSRLNRDP